MQPRRRLTTFGRILPASLLAAGMAMLALPHPVRAADPEQAPAVASIVPTVTISPAIRSTVQERVPVSGTLVARSEVQVYPQVSGYEINELLVEVGDSVTAGQPLARLTELGLRQIEPELLEAADAFGATAAQRLTSVELPLAVPSILQGINQTTMMALAMVVVASMIGAPGLGQTVLEGLQRADVGTGLIGGTAIVILAIVLDRITQAFGARKLASGQETAP